MHGLDTQVCCKPATDKRGASESCQAREKGSAATWPLKRQKRCWTDVEGALARTKSWCFSPFPFLFELGKGEGYSPKDCRNADDVGTVPPSYVVGACR